MRKSTKKLFRRGEQQKYAVRTSVKTVSKVKPKNTIQPIKPVLPPTPTMQKNTVLLQPIAPKRPPEESIHIPLTSLAFLLFVAGIAGGSIVYWQTLTTFFSNITVPTPQLPAIPTVDITPVVSGISQTITGAVQTLMTLALVPLEITRWLVNSILTFYWTFFNPMVTYDTLINFHLLVFTIVIQAVLFIWHIFATGVLTILQGMKSIAESIINAIAWFFLGIFHFIGVIFNAIFGFFNGIFTGIGNSITNTQNSIDNSISNFFTMLDPYTSYVGKAWNETWQAMGEMVTHFVQTIEEISHAIQEKK